MKPKDLRVGTVLSVRGKITHRYETYAVLQLSSGTTIKVTAEDEPVIVSQPMGPGDLVNRVGYGGTVELIEILKSDPKYAVIRSTPRDSPSVVLTSSLSMPVE